MPRIDDEEEKDSILEHLLGEVDDFAGSQLPDDEDKPEKPEGDPAAKGGVEISIVVTPKTGGDKPKGGSEEAGEEDESEHDDIAHALGLHDGGCVY